MKIEHHFLTTSHDIRGLFDGVNKISTFCTNLEKQANLRTESYPYEKYVGDGFELLVEMIIKLSQTDNRIGIADYKPIQSNNDNGVDGYGINLLNKKCAVQVKYRSDNNKLLTATSDGLDSFMTEAMFESVLPEITDPCKNHYIFTTAEGLHYYTENEKYRKSIKVIGYNHLREMFDKNAHFWNSVREIINQNLDR